MAAVIMSRTRFIRIFSIFEIKLWCKKYVSPQAIIIRKLNTVPNKSGKCLQFLRKYVVVFTGVCFGCITSLQLHHWLKNRDFELKRLKYVAYAKTSSSKSKQFNFIADIVEIIGPAVVHIEGQLSSGAGSGFLVSDEGLVLTNAHVVQNMRYVMVTLSDGTSMRGDIINIDRVSDLAAVQLHNVPKRKFATIKLGDSSQIRPGEFVVAMGSPLRLANTVTSGIVSTVHRSLNDVGRNVEYIQTDAAINVGNSGGPLVNLDGELIGINSMTVRGAVGISFAIPVSIVKEFLENTMKTKSTKSTKGYIGIHMLTLAPGIIEELTRRIPDFPNVKGGIFIPEVVFNSPSHRAGLYPGDIITRINGTPVNNSQQVYDFVAKGEPLNIEILRGRKCLTVVVQPEVFH